MHERCSTEPQNPNPEPPNPQTQTLTPESLPWAPKRSAGPPGAYLCAPCRAMRAAHLGGGGPLHSPACVPRFRSPAPPILWQGPQRPGPPCNVLWRHAHALPASHPLPLPVHPVCALCERWWIRHPGVGMLPCCTALYCIVLPPALLWLPCVAPTPALTPRLPCPPARPPARPQTCTRPPSKPPPCPPASTTPTSTRWGQWQRAMAEGYQLGLLPARFPTIVHSGGGGKGGGVVLEAGVGLGRGAGGYRGVVVVCGRRGRRAGGSTRLLSCRCTPLTLSGA